MRADWVAAADRNAARCHAHVPALGSIGRSLHLAVCASLSANYCSTAQLLQRHFISACDHQSDRGVPAARLLPSFLAQFRQLRLHVQGGANGAAADLSTADSGAAAGEPPAAEAAEAADGAAAHSDDHDRRNSMQIRLETARTAVMVTAKLSE